MSVTDGVSTTTYEYNGDGDRVAQEVDGVRTEYMLDTAVSLTMVLAETTNPGLPEEETIYYLHGLDLVAQSDGTSTEYFVNDGLGSVRQLVDPVGEVLLAQTYDPYGNLYASAGVDVTALGYAGEQEDANGLVSLRARYYSPSLGRFLNMDPRRQEMNPYVYGGNNPIMFTDPSGLCVFGLDCPIDPDPFIDRLEQMAYNRVMSELGFAYEFTDILTLGVFGKWCERGEILSVLPVASSKIDDPHFELGRWTARLVSILWAYGEYKAGPGVALTGMVTSPPVGTALGVTSSALLVAHSYGILVTVTVKEIADPLLSQTARVWAAAANGATGQPPNQGGGGGSGPEKVNPTGRNIASETPTSWQDAERILGKDLGLPKNTSRFSKDIYGLKRDRIPDFVGDNFIADAKWYGKSRVSNTSQLRDFARISENTGKPLWLYVRQNTKVSNTVLDAIENTGGGIVRYFP